MKRFHPHDSHSEHPNVIPLIDVMLCIIVFYMLCARIGVDTGVDQDIEVPVTAIGKDLQAIGTNNIILNLKDGGDRPIITAMAEGGSAKAEFPVTSSTGQSPLTQMLTRLRFGADRKPGGNDDNANLAVILRADGQMSFRNFAPVLKAVYDAKVTNVAYNTKKPEARAAN
jgi:biopolymer transport protein ExbD